MTEKITAALCLLGTLFVLGLAGFFAIQNNSLEFVTVLSNPLNVTLGSFIITGAMALGAISALGVASNGKFGDLLA